MKIVSRASPSPSSSAGAKSSGGDWPAPERAQPHIRPNHHCPARADLAVARGGLEHSRPGPVGFRPRDHRHVPSWMVAHRGNVCYMLRSAARSLRPYPGASHLPREIAASPVARCGRTGTAAATAAALPNLRAHARGSRAGASLPGCSLSRSFGPRCVHCLDRVGGARRDRGTLRFSRRCRTLDYFPAAAQVHVVCPLRTRRQARGRSTISYGGRSIRRNASAADRGMRHVRADVPLLIAGTGPDERELRRWPLRSADPVPGFKLRLARSAVLLPLAVPFVPTTGTRPDSARRCRRKGRWSPRSTPVPARAVPWRNRLVCPADPAAIGYALEKPCRDRAFARRSPRRTPPRGNGHVGRGRRRARDE